MGRKHRKCSICSKNEFNIDFFAAFPTDEERCKEWVRVIGNEDLVQIPIEKLNQLRFVCGDHFEKKLFTNKGNKRLKKGAVPSLNLTAAPLTADQLIDFPQHLESYRKPITVMLRSNPKSDRNMIIINEDHNASYFESVEEETQLENMQICRACLVTNVKMYDMKSLPILTAYLELTGISDFGSYTHICYECAARLRRCEGFRLNCFKADETLKQMVTKGILRRDRKRKRLESPLQLSAVTIVDSTKVDSDNLTLTITAPQPIKVENNHEETLFIDNFIKKESDNTHINSDTEDKIDCEKEKDKIDFASDDNVTSDFEIVQPYDSSCEVKKEIVNDVKKKAPVKRKKRTVVATDVSDDDDAPLSKLPKTRKKRVTKPKENEPNDTVTEKKNNKIKFDPKAFEEYATVFLMTPEEAKKEVELRKESSNYKDCQFKCNFCYRGYESQNTYNNHMKKHNVSYGSFSCEFCRLRFPKRHELGKHVMSCHRRKFLCNLCPFICYSIARAKIHMSLHKGVKYTCDQCGQNFRMPNTLLRHKRDKHSKQCVCDICGSTFVNEKGLHAHNKLVHKQDVNLKQGPVCTECDIHFSTELAWKRHLVLSSKHQISNGCETCGETFDTESSLKSHLKLHARRRPRADDVPLPAACTICTKWLTSRVEFKSHMTSQHPECDVTRRIEQECPYVCEFCGKRFQFRVHMFIHQRMHTGERPYSCSVCSRQFAFPASLTSHLKTHSATRRLLHCHMCEKVFKTKYAHTKHVKLIHLNIRPHSCDVCGKSYHNLCEVKYHKQHAHGNVPWPKRDRSKRKAFEEPAAYIE